MKNRSVVAPFIRELHRARSHLYDPAALQNSPLMAMFGVDLQENAASALRRILLDGIESLKPNDEAPLQSNAWRYYHILRHRYGEQFTQHEVATDLGLSIRQLRRQEKQALELLADYLWNHYDLAQVPLRPQGTSSQASAETSNHQNTTPSRSEEMEWAQKVFPGESAAVKELLQEALRTANPLIQALRVHVECPVREELPRLAVQLVTVRQGLLNVLTTTARCVPGGWITIRAETHHREVRIQISADPLNPTSSLTLAEEVEGFAIARELIGISGGNLEIISAEDGSGWFTAQITLPIEDQITVLAIDDNPDTLELLQRYTANTRYPLVGVRDPNRAMTLAEELLPDIIVLDIMLPSIDGWAILGRLRAHPKLGNVPIIVCTILPQEQLARSLGASAFIRKPVNRQVFLSALNAQADTLR